MDILNETVYSKPRSPRGGKLGIRQLNTGLADVGAANHSNLTQVTNFRGIVNFEKTRVNKYNLR